MKYLVISAMTLLSFAACKNKATTHDEHAMHAGRQVYACPMHPEVTGNEGDKCPKCGMLLEPVSTSAGNETYQMKFTSEPAQIASGREVVFSLKPQITGKETEEVPLEIKHEKKIHLIIVSEDLGFFDHIHPELAADGSYKVPYTFKHGGSYLLFADYQPSGGGSQIEKISVEVAGDISPAKFGKQKLTSSSGSFEISLISSSGKFLTGSEQHILASVKKNGKIFDANELENYLGAKAHVVMIGLENKDYVHVHPDVENKGFHMHATFAHPGLYRAWVQFSADGKIHTTDFVINVESGAATTAGNNTEEAHDHSHDHGSGHTH